MPITLTACLCVVSLGCASSPMFPESLTKGADQNVEFGVLQADPEVYRGRVILLAGRIIGVEQRQEGTVLLVHQLPIVKKPSYRPVETSAPTGRFAVLFPGKLEPVDATTGNRLIALGSIQGFKELTLHGTSETAPYLIARCLHVWETAGEEISQYVIEHGGDGYPQIEQTYCVR